MTEAAGPLPALTVVTEAIFDVGPFVPLLSARHPLVFIRRGDGIAGFGEALRLEFSGPSRLTDAAAAWRSIVAAATVTDPIAKLGSGLVAFGSFAFAAESAATSLLIVPSVLLGRYGDISWITRVTTSAVPSRAGIPTPRPFGPEYRTSLLPGAMSSKAFRNAAASVVKRIHRTGLRKVVLARDLIGHLPADADLRRTIAKLSISYPDTFTYAIDGLIGSSPETLVRSEGGAVSARVLAGSTARGSDDAADHAAEVTLASSSKERDEHEFALRSVMSALKPHSIDLAASDLPFALKLPNLWHLASDVHGALGDGSTALDLVAALHPTAAVAGAPTETALATIGELEPFDRGRYAGPVGWVGANGDGEWAIALRCAQVTESGDVTAYAGAGIIAGSVPEAELAETTLKFRPIIEAFG